MRSGVWASGARRESCTKVRACRHPRDTLQEHGAEAHSRMPARPKGSAGIASTVPPTDVLRS
eukprot:2994203-Prymnesium_polylepis.1